MIGGKTEGCETSCSILFKLLTVLKLLVLDFWINIFCDVSEHSLTLL